MKLLILSDSHGAVENMELAVRLEQPDAVIHLGDHWRDACDLRDLFPDLPLYQVSGNCDRYAWQPDLEERRLTAFDGNIFFMVHGHQYGVKNGLLRLQLAAKEAGARVMLFGHTHRAYAEQLDDILLFNPGACSGYRPTYGLICVDGRSLNWEIKEL